MAGTPGYMSPEQCRGDPVDGRTDIYALAATLFEMLTGARTFRGNSPEVLQQVVSQDAPLVSSIRPGLPAGLDAMIAKALARDPADRYASMREFREAFSAVLVQARANLNTVAFRTDKTTPATPAERRPSAASQAAGDPATVTLSMTGSSPVRFPEPSADRLSALAQSISVIAPRKTGGQERPRILFLDDEERILGALSALFRLQYEVLVSTNGAQALEIVKTHQPHVIVSDQRMPNMLGVDFLRQARELDPSSVRILLTGYSDLAAIVGSINDGEVFRFVNKPWGNQEIKDTIAQAMEISLATRQAPLAALPAIEVSEARRATEAILVAQNTREFFEFVNDGFGRTRPVCYAADVASVLQTIEDQEVAILLCDLDGFDGADVMLKMLKQSHPQIQSVAIAASSDSASLISLINQAQIFRFMNRPLRMGLLERGLRSALAVYASYKARPALLQRQKVQVKPEVAESSIGRQIFQRLGFLTKPKVASSN